MKRDTYGLGLPCKDLVPRLVHGSKVVHAREKDIKLDDVLDVTPGLLQNGGDVAQGLPLPGESSVKPP